ncbi:MAG: dihydrofolate reductase family protein [Hyphomicrobiales bacterium]|nr:dihydrofolate reductase family protein [Hyphomicrobiales bacterium]
MRKLIAGMKMSLDGKVEGPDGVADWVEAWSEDYGLTPRIGACLLGAGMYGGYERYWSGIQAEPEKPAWISGTPPTQAEREWADFITRTPHYVLSTTLDATLWPDTKVLRGEGDVAELKRKPGKDIYLVGGARAAAGMIDAGLLDELHLIVYPLVAAGEGSALFGTSRQRRSLTLMTAAPLPDGRVRLAYAIG